MFQTRQEKFIYSQIIMMTLSATLQRNTVYLNANETERREVRKGIELELNNLSKNYLNCVSEKEHEKNIIHLANSISKKYNSYLENGRFRIGTAQKALNLFLKYLWCLEKIHEPPHFPIDAIMLAKIPDCSGIYWTKLDSIDSYKEIIQKAKNVANGQTLSIWELYEYST